MSLDLSLEDLRSRTKVISSVYQCLTVINSIYDEGQVHYSDDPWRFSEDKLAVVVDCEGHNLGQFGTISLIQIATMQGKVYVFDLLSCPKMMDGIRKLLQDWKVVKVIHDCRNDISNLWTEFGVIVIDVFDTQVAYAIIEHQIDEGDSVPFRSVTNRISLNNLCKVAKISINPLKDQNMYRYDSKYWMTRPLTDEMLLNAAADAFVLTQRQLYYKLARSISIVNRKFMVMSPTYETGRTLESSQPIVYGRAEHSLSYSDIFVRIILLGFLFFLLIKLVDYMKKE